MPTRVHEFAWPDRVVVGTIGLPGERTFYLQVRAGTQIVSIALEKQQSALLAEKIDEINRAAWRTRNSLRTYAERTGWLDPGEAAIVPLLRARRRERIDLAVITHPHPDHYGGLRALLDRGDEVVIAACGRSSRHREGVRVSFGRP